MRITLDTQVDALSIVLSDNEVAQTIDAGGGRLVDVDEYGEVVAIEVLNASEGIKLHDLAADFDLETLYDELAARVLQARDGLQDDPRLREVLAAQ